MSNYAEIQAGIYNKASKKAKAISDMIINSRLSKREIDSIIFIVQLEVMQRNERKEQKKVIQMAEYKEQHHGQGPGSAAEPPEGASNESRE